MARYLICITGASGAIYGIRLLGALCLPAAGFAPHDLHLVVSPWGERVILEETGRSSASWVDQLRLAGGRITCHEPGNLAAPVASGSFRLDGTVIAPCSMGSAGSIASGATRNLVHRSAMVALKEGWPLVLVPRESPLGLIDLRNLTTLAESGAAIMPACPGFYSRPQGIEELVDGFVARILDRLGAHNPLAKPWTGSTIH